MFDPPHQPVQRRGMLGFDRRALAVLSAMGNHDIHHVAVECRVFVKLAQRSGKTAIATLCRGLQEQVGMCGDVLLDLQDVIGHRLDGAQCRVEFLHPRRHRARGRFGVQLFDPFGMRAFQSRSLTQDIGQILLQARDLFLDLVLFLFGKLAEILGFQNLAILERGQHEPHGRPQQGHAFGAGGIGEIAHRAFLLFGVFLIYCAALGLVFVGFEHRRQIPRKIVHKILHRRPQARGMTRRQRQRAGFVRGVEIVHVNPVDGQGALAGLRLEHLFGGGMPPGSAWPQNEQVEIAVGHFRRQADRLERAILTDQIAVIGQFIRGAKRKAGRIAARAQFFRRQSGHGHLVAAEIENRTLYRASLRANRAEI